MARFGPNGFNQSFGNRYTVMSEKEFLTLSSRLKRCELNSKDFFDLDIPDNSLLFLDPPYVERPTSYKTIDNTFFSKLIQFIKETDNDVLYTDIDHNFLNMDKVTLRDQMRNTAPSSNKELTNKEIMFYKIKA